MLLLIIVIVRLTNNIPFNVLVLNLGDKGQIASTTSTSSEPIYNSTPPAKASAAPTEQLYKSDNSEAIKKLKTDQLPSLPIEKNERPSQQKLNRNEEPAVKMATISPSKQRPVSIEEYVAPQKKYPTNNSSRETIKNSAANQTKDGANFDQSTNNNNAEQTNGNSPYSYNRSAAYSTKNKSFNTSSPKSVDSKKYNTNSSRFFSQSEMNEFIRQYPNRSTYIHFVNFGSADDEMEEVRSQIIGMLNNNGYYEIDKNWFVYNGYTEIKEVHFGVNGNTAVNFYIPSIRNRQ